MLQNTRNKDVTRDREDEAKIRPPMHVSLKEGLILQHTYEVSLSYPYTKPKKKEKTDSLSSF